MQVAHHRARSMNDIDLCRIQRLGQSGMHRLGLIAQFQHVGQEHTRRPPSGTMRAPRLLNPAVIDSGLAL